MRVCQTKFIILGHSLGLDLIPALLYLFVRSGLCKAFSGLTYNPCLFVRVFGIHTSSSLWVHAVPLVLSLFACLFGLVWVHAVSMLVQSVCLFGQFGYTQPHSSSACLFVCLSTLGIRAIGCTYKLVYIYVARVHAAPLVLCLGLHLTWAWLSTSQL